MNKGRDIEGGSAPTTCPICCHNRWNSDDCIWEAIKKEAMKKSTKPLQKKAKRLRATTFAITNLEER